MADVEGQLLADLAARNSIPDSSEYAASRDLQHSQVVGVIKSLLAAGLVEGEVWHLWFAAERHCDAYTAYACELCRANLDLATLRSNAMLAMP